MEKAFSFSATREQAEKEFGLGKGEYFKLKEGINKFRLMSEVVGYESVYDGKKRFQWACWVIDRADGVVKPYFMQKSIYTEIENFQLNPEYTFTTVPMPYDITVVAKNAGKLEAEYTVTPARQNTPVTEEEMKAFSERLPIQEFISKLKEKQGGVQTVEQAAEVVGGTVEQNEEVPFN